MAPELRLRAGSELGGDGPVASLVSSSSCHTPATRCTREAYEKRPDCKSGLHHLRQSSRGPSARYIACIGEMRTSAFLRGKSSRRCRRNSVQRSASLVSRRACLHFINGSAWPYFFSSGRRL